MKPHPRLLKEESTLLILAKPPHIHSVSISKNRACTVASWLNEKYPDQGVVSEQPGEAGLIHRLDYETSGLLLAARSRAVWKAMRKQFSSDQSKKEYLALVSGKPEKSGEIESYLGARHRGSKKVSVFLAPPKNLTRVVQRTTRYNLIHHFRDDQISLVSINIGAGMRHQIRAHLAHAGHPLVGDKTYGSQASLPGWLKIQERNFFLHCWKISFFHPVEKIPLDISCDEFLPDEMKSLMNSQQRSVE